MTAQPQKLLSLPENLVDVFHSIEKKDHNEWFVTCDPQGTKVGSGGGTAWLIAADWTQRFSHLSFDQYLHQNKRILIHAGGQSRRLPAYAPSGKILTPIPVFRWSRGQSLKQNLLDLQVPLYEQVMALSAPQTSTLIASGDVLVIAPKLPSQLPAADVVCFANWVDPHLASRHGVFFTPKHNTAELAFMLQKPPHDTIETLSSDYLFLMDIGIWLLSNKAVKVLMDKCGWESGAFEKQTPNYYDLYSSFGTCLGSRPTDNDDEISSLSVAIVPLHDGEFYHYGTSGELITSTEKIQNRVLDQRSILHHRIKPHPSLFVQNSVTVMQWDNQHRHIWIENSHVPASWHLSSNHVITGVPRNNWHLNLAPNICIDIVPVGEDDFCIRPYGMSDSFSGDPVSPKTNWMGEPLANWFSKRGIDLLAYIPKTINDIQNADLFPVVKLGPDTDKLIRWMLPEGSQDDACTSIWLNAARISANKISAKGNLSRLYEQRREFRLQNLPFLAKNHSRSVFYQSDLKQTAMDYASADLTLPAPLPANTPLMIQIQDKMFRSEIAKLKSANGINLEKEAFGILQTLITSTIAKKESPKLNVFADQIVWGRSPVRLDLAGGWTDTPPYCIQNGGMVVNMAVNLNGQPPLQVFIRLSDKHSIVLRSIDNGVAEEITSYDELAAYDSVGSAFSIPRAALCLAGFHPQYCEASFASLRDQLMDFGGGLEISLLAAVPKGSGLGTSSILAATLLGTLSDFCNLNWDKQQICHRALVLEQLLTTGGGWQDQYGGIIGGIKLLETEPGAQEKMGIRWLPDTLFSSPEFSGNWLLYYTGITRIAKNILSEIVRGMFLNEGDRLQVLDQIGKHAIDMYDAIQKNDYAAAAAFIDRSWQLNNLLDPGTNTPEIQTIIDKIKDHTLGLKLLGAGGGGYMLICAKDANSARIIKQTLNASPINSRARFVKMDINIDGFQVTRS